MLRRLRPVTAAVLALAFVAGPVSAACLHGLDHGADHVAAGHEMPDAGHEMPMGDEPCHDEPPAPEPETHDCDAPCCTGGPVAEAPTLPVLPSDLAGVVLPVVGTAWTARRAAPGVMPREQPPPLRRRHVELQRFLI